MDHRRSQRRVARKRGRTFSNPKSRSLSGNVGGSDFSSFELLPPIVTPRWIFRTPPPSAQRTGELLPRLLCPAEQELLQDDDFPQLGTQK